MSRPCIRVDGVPEYTSRLTLCFLQAARTFKVPVATQSSVLREGNTDGRRACPSSLGRELRTVVVDLSIELLWMERADDGGDVEHDVRTGDHGLDAIGIANVAEDELDLAHRFSRRLIRSGMKVRGSRTSVRMHTKDPAG